MSVIGNGLHSMPVTNVNLERKKIYKWYFFLILLILEYNQILFIHLRSYSICARTYIIVHLYLSYTNKINLMTLCKLQGSRTWCYNKIRNIKN
jgi:hypothetical protein